MPADPLATPAIIAGAPVHSLVDAVHSVLTGTPLTDASRRHGLTADELADAVETYHHAGSTALYDHLDDDTWWQAHLEFAAWEQAEHIATSILAPHLNTWVADGLLDRWWFIRKAPCWRLRLRPHTSPRDTLIANAAGLFDRLTDDGHLTRWRPTHYEPESPAFGGPIGIGIAHDLFSADSTHLAAYLHTHHRPLGRCELSLLLCTALFRSAGQEWFETGDIWNHVTQLRPAPNHTNTDTHHHTTLVRQLRTLLNYDTRPTGPLFSAEGPLAAVHAWARAFHDAGQALAAAADQASLQRGHRKILAHHVIFHWNRLGLDASTQHALAHAATIAVLHHNPPTANPAPSQGPTRTLP